MVFTKGKKPKKDIACYNLGMTQKWVLETRTCLCGCLKTFRVLPSSSAKYASFWHEHSFDSWFEIDGDRLQKPSKNGLGPYYDEVKNPLDVLNLSSDVY